MIVYIVKERWLIECELCTQCECTVFFTREKADEYAKKAAKWFCETDIEGGRYVENSIHDYEVENDNNEWLEIDIEEKSVQ